MRLMVSTTEGPEGQPTSELQEVDQLPGLWNVWKDNPPESQEG